MKTYIFQEFEDRVEVTVDDDGEKQIATVWNDGRRHFSTMSRRYCSASGGTDYAGHGRRIIKETNSVCREITEKLERLI